MEVTLSRQSIDDLAEALAAKLRAPVNPVTVLTAADDLSKARDFARQPREKLHSYVADIEAALKGKRCGRV